MLRFLENHLVNRFKSKYKVYNKNFRSSLKSCSQQVALYMKEGSGTCSMYNLYCTIKYENNSDQLHKVNEPPIDTRTQIFDRFRPPSSLLPVVLRSAGYRLLITSDLFGHNDEASRKPEPLQLQVYKNYTNSNFKLCFSFLSKNGWQKNTKLFLFINRT